jgi:hypothetical protein
LQYLGRRDHYLEGWELRRQLEGASVKEMLDIRDKLRDRAHAAGPQSEARRTVDEVAARAIRGTDGGHFTWQQEPTRERRATMERLEKLKAESIDQVALTATIAVAPFSPFPQSSLKPCASTRSSAKPAERKKTSTTNYSARLPRKLLMCEEP